MAEREEREQWAVKSDEHRTDFARAKSTTPLKAGAVLLWLLGLALAAAGIVTASGSVDAGWLTDLPGLTVVVALVLDLVLALAAQRLWKRSGSSGKAEVGAALTCLAFAPMCLFFLAAKNAGARTKALAVGAAIVEVAAISVCCLVLRG